MLRQPVDVKRAFGPEREENGKRDNADYPPPQHRGIKVGFPETEGRLGGPTRYFPETPFTNLNVRMSAKSVK
jgi:hypothetical protein